jgi:hypothetical protein
VFIKLKPGKYGIRVWVPAQSKNFYAHTMYVYTGKTDEAMEKKQGFRIVSCVVCYMYGTGRGVTADNFVTSCVLANLFLI